MKVKCTKSGTQSLKLPFMDAPVDFGPSDTAEVEPTVGDRLVDELDAIIEIESAVKPRDSDG